MFKKIIQYKWDEAYYMRIFKKYDFLFINKNYEFFFGLWLFKAEHFHWVKIYIFLQLKLDLKKNIQLHWFIILSFFFTGCQWTLHPLNLANCQWGFSVFALWMYFLVSFYSSLQQPTAIIGIMLHLDISVYRYILVEFLLSSIIKNNWI